MSTKKFSEAIGGIDDKYIEKALSYGCSAKNTSASRIKRRLPLPLAAAIMVILLMGSVAAAAFLSGDLWIQKPSSDPVGSVRSALENQIGKDYTIKIEVKSVEIDEAETSRTVERFINGPIAYWNDWSIEYLTEHFLAVKAVYYAEYDHTQTTRSDGEVTMYFYLVQDVDGGEWIIVDNSGNINLSKNDSAIRNGGSGVDSGNGDTVVKTAQEQLFSYLSELFNEAYSPYYDGLRYEMNVYEETTDGSEITATFLWTMHFLGKRWDVASDEGVEQEVNWFLQATTTVNKEGILNFEMISVLVDESPVGEANYSTPIEDHFPM